MGDGLLERTSELFALKLREFASADVLFLRLCSLAATVLAVSLAGGVRVTIETEMCV